MELVLAFALGLALKNLVASLVQGVVESPIRSHDEAGWSDLSFNIYHRTFTFLTIVMSAIAFMIVGLVAVWFSRHNEDRLWDAEPAATCPHCLSEISAVAHVCPYCTRDVT